MSDSSSRSPFDDLRRALDGGLVPVAADLDPASPSVRVDLNRLRRTGIPEVVHAANKSPKDVANALRQLAEAEGRALASRVPADVVEALRTMLEPEFGAEWIPDARAVVVRKHGVEPIWSGGVVGVLSAGTSDIPFAAEAALMAAEMGCEVLQAWDVGVAGLHRLIEPLERFAAADTDAIIVAAGMDGALPAVVAGLVSVPVIGLPTSIGYGLGAAGVGALTSMLQSCAPGLVVVNIDNGIGAGSSAALIANRAALARSGKRR